MEYSELIEQDSFFGFMSKVRTIKHLEPEREYQLSVQFVTTDDVAAAHENIVAHIPLVLKVAFQYKGYNLPTMDLIQEGVVGLMKALQKFDPYKGYRFATFAVWWVKAYIKNYIISSWKLVKIGTSSMQRKLFFRVGMIGDHESQESRLEKINELSKEWEVKSDDLINLEARVRSKDISLNECVGNSGDESITLLPDWCPTQDQLLEDKMSDHYKSEVVSKALKTLDPRERFIIQKRYMTDETPWTFLEIGEHLNTSRQRVHQVEKRAMKKLKDFLEPHKVQLLEA